MNALDALFSRQVPTRSASGGVTAGAAASTGESLSDEGGFTTALSGEMRKQARGGDGKDRGAVDSHEIEIDDADAADIDDLEIDVELAGMFDLQIGTAIRRTNDGPDTVEGQDAKRDDEAAFDLEGVVLSAGKLDVGLQDAETGNAKETAQTVELKSDSDRPQSDLKQEAVTQAKPEPGIRIDMQGAAYAGREMASPVPGGRKQAAIDKSAITDRDDAGTRAGQGSAKLADKAMHAERIMAPDAKGDSSENRLAQGRERQSTPLAGRGERDVAVDNVRVIERRSVTAPTTANNGEVVAKALVQDAAQMSQALRGEGARLAQTPQTANAQHAAFATNTAAPKALQTLSIQLNPHSLGQVTAVLKMSGDELSVELKVQTSEAYRQLKDDSTLITKALRAQGYGVENISIQLAPVDRSSMTAQQNLQSGNGGSQFQFNENDARSAGGHQSGTSGRQGRAGQGGQQPGENAHEHQSGSPNASRRTDGVYL